MKKKVLKYAFLTVAYLLLAILFTWPLVTQLTTHGFGVDEDSPYHIWHNWWFKFSIFKLHQSPLFTDYIFHPQNIPLVFDANAFVFSALTLPLQLFMSVLTASNIVFIFSSVLSGIGMYFLAKSILCSCGPLARPDRRLAKGEQLQIEIPSFIAGVIYAFSPYTLAQAIDGHINLTSTWMLPFYAYFLLKTLSFVILRAPNIAEGPPRRFFGLRPQNDAGWVKYALCAGIFSGLQTLNDLTYTAFTIIFTGLVVGFSLLQTTLSHSGLPRIRFWGRTPATFAMWGDPPQNDKIKKTLITGYRLLITIIPPLTIIALTSFLIFLPVLIPTIKVYRMGLKPDAPLWVQNVWSADLIAFFRPNDHSTFLKSISYTPPRGTVEGTVFVGYTVMVLALVSILIWVRRLLRVARAEGVPPSAWTPSTRGKPSGGTSPRQDPQAQELGGWIFLAASFFIFSLGPFLKISDTWKWNILGHQLPIPLPFILLHKVPLIGGTQEPARMNPFLTLPLAILAANGICALLSPRHSGEERSDDSRILSISRFWTSQNDRTRKSLSLSLALCLGVLIVLEFLQLPFPTTNLEPPPIYAEIAKDPEYFSVLTLPVGFNSGQIALGKSPIGSLQYYQVIHQKPSFRGTVARLPAWTFDYYRDLPLFRIFIDPNRSPEPEDLDKKSAKKIFKDQLHIKYIVIHKDKFEGGLEKTKNLIEEVLEAKKIEESERTISYTLR